MVLAGEQQVGTVVLQGYRDPVVAALGLRPNKTADPRRIWRDARRAVVADRRFDLFANLLGHREPDPYLALSPLVSRLPAAFCQAVDRIRRVEIENYDVRRDDGLSDHHGGSGDRFRPGIGAYGDIITLNVKRSLLEHQRPARVGRMDP